MVVGGWAAGVKTDDRKEQLMVRRSEAGKARAERLLEMKRSVQRHVKYAFYGGSCGFLKTKVVFQHVCVLSRGH